MTQRARWLVLLGLLGFGLGVLRSQPGLAWSSLTLLLWIFGEWLAFCWRLWRELPCVQVRRLVNDRPEATGYLWAGRNVRILVEIFCSSGSIGPVIVVKDCLEENLRVVSGCSSHGLLNRTGTLTFRYEVQPQAAGEVVLPGVRFTLQDAQGFFVSERFFSLEQRFLVLPAFSGVGDVQSLVKRMNSLPKHGIHRLQRAGMGSELLELREYADGDPPKSIAWKVSARRDTLMTRQYESEVPIRVCLFVDGTIATRVGGFGYRLLDQINFVAASVARAAIATGDSVGVVLFDERGQKRIAPAGGDRAFYGLLKELAVFSANPQAPRQRLTPVLLNAALRLCGERYPELMSPRINRVPFTWLPISPWKRKALYQRSLLAGVLAELYHESPAGLIELIHDDNRLAPLAQSFLNDAGLAWMAPVIPMRNQGFHSGIASMEMLSKALTTSVAMARDNEVYVILANLLECATSIDTLVPAVRMALARHHRVVVVCPSPTFRRPPKHTPLSDVSVEGMLEQAEDIRTRELSQRLRRSLARIGATVSVSGEQQAIRMVLAETELARSGRIALSARHR